MYPDFVTQYLIEILFFNSLRVFFVASLSILWFRIIIRAFRVVYGDGAFHSDDFALFLMSVFMSVIIAALLMWILLNVPVSSVL